MNKPNPAWVNAPYEVAEWNALIGFHLTREKSRRIEGDELIITVEFVAEDKVIGTE